MKSTIQLIFLLSIFTFELHGQQSKGTNWNLRTDFHYGFVLPEYQHFNYLVDESVKGFEISAFKRTIGKNSWEKIYRYPEAGLTFQFTTLGNRLVFGNELALFPYVSIPLVRKKHFVLFNQFGCGIGYATKKFDLASNYENVSVGSHINVHFNYKLGAQVKLGKRFTVNTGLSFIHYSNANMAEPNLGVNILAAYLGTSMSLTKQDAFMDPSLEVHNRKHEFDFIYAAGGKHTRALQSSIYFTSSASVEYHYHLGRKIHIGGGIDFFYDSATETEMKALGKGNYKNRDAFNSGIHFSQEIVYHSFSFILQEGFYVGLLDEINESPIYNRAIVRWKFNEHILMSISMKSHLHILDYPELGLGYYFTKSQNEK